MKEKEYEKLLEKVKKGKERKYKIKEGSIYKENKEGKLLKIIRRFELEPLLYLFHDDPIGGYYASEAMYWKIKERYYWKGMKYDLEEYVRTCDQCQRRGKPVGKNELHPIVVREPFYQIGIDIVGPLPLTSLGNKYIIVAIDYFTKWTEAKALKEATAEEVATFIYEEIICRHGPPRRIISDRGTHFNNKIVEELLKKFGTKHRLSTPYHPKTNGLVERFNRTLCEALAKLGEERKNWDKYIAPSLAAHRFTKQRSTRIEPFYLTYGRKVRFITDEEEQEEVTIKERIRMLIEELPKIWNTTREQIKRSQEKQKEYHDKKIKKKHIFEIGEKVTYAKAAYFKQWSRKLEEKWKGPYYIHEILLNGSYSLKDKEGRILKTPVNGELLKKYYSRENYQSFVVI